LRIVEYVAACIGFIGVTMYFEGVRWWTIALAIIWVLVFGTILIADMFDEEIFPWDMLH
jgi:hypothetical protein